MKLAVKGWKPKLSQKGVRLFNAKDRFILLDGPRKSGKTIHACHKIAKHLYTVPNAVVCVVTKRTKSAKQGVWGDLTKFVIEQGWQEEGGRLHYIVPPRIASDSRQNYFCVKNAHKGQSSCYLYPIQYAHEAEAIFKQTRFSAVYICEADLWNSSSLFHAAADQLRIIGLPFDDHQMILDCNPPSDGNKHWLYELFVDPSVERSKHFRRMQFLWDDNPWLVDDEKADLVARYKTDPQKWRRYVLGEWIMSTDGSLFEDVFRPDVHIIGTSKAGKPNSEWDVLVPPDGSFDLITGSDLGDINHAAVILSKRWDDEGNVSFDVIDEVVSIQKPVSIDEFIKELMKKIDVWEGYMREHGAGNIRRADWSDSSSFKYSSVANSSQALVAHNASKGRVSLNSVAKGAGSVASRIELTRRLLFENRLYISAKCPNLIETLSRLATTKKTGTLRTSTRLLHAFDALSYALISEVPMELMKQAEKNETRNDKIISIPL